MDNVCGTYIATAAKLNAIMKKFKSRVKPVRSGLKWPWVPRRFQTEMAISEIDNVANIKGAPRIEPTPISSLVATF